MSENLRTLFALCEHTRKACSITLGLGCTCGNCTRWRNLPEEPDGGAFTYTHKCDALHGPCDCGMCELTRVTEECGGYDKERISFLEADNARLLRERDNARAIARALAHAWTHDSRPHPRYVTEAMAFPKFPGGDS